MCEYCGCRGVAPIAELMDEHTALVEQASHVRQALSSGDPVTALSRLTQLLTQLDRHVRREEDGIFRALRNAEEFLDELGALESEHRGFETAAAALDVAAPEYHAQVSRLLDDLEVHVEREDLGIFPVSVTTLGATGWAIVDQAHTESPSFLHDSVEETTVAP